MKNEEIKNDSEKKPVTKKVTIKNDQKFFNRLHEKYVKEVVPALLPKYKNVNAVPKIEKIVVNTRLGDVRDNTKSLTGAVEELGLITGQKPIVTLAKKSISNFKLREGQKIGAKVTLRGKKMYEFLDKVLSIALPRVRDFSGISTKSFDRFGNYSLGFKEQLVFPEISYEKIDKVRGFDITIVTTAKNREDSLEFLTAMGFPYKKEAK
ncbi:MAG: 50S ribosomal protein L5 [Christensenellaceae bacterium]|jgi:large subunit ribosomal protein L5|nr:50S ribosomal protein L5 [Christensenellaceae bacterium]